MELTGKQKSQILISLLEETSSSVLKELSKQSSKKLSDSLEDVPELDSKEQQLFLNNALEAIKAIQFDTKSDLDSEQNEITDDSLDSLELDEDDLASEDEVEESEEDEAKSSYPENYRNIEVIVTKLTDQSLQMIAFFLSQLEDPLKTDIEQAMDQQMLQQV